MKRRLGIKDYTPKNLESYTDNYSSLRALTPKITCARLSQKSL